MEFSAVDLASSTSESGVNLSSMFEGQSNLRKVSITHVENTAWNGSASSLQAMFKGCTRLGEGGTADEPNIIDLSGIGTSLVNGDYASFGPAQSGMQDMFVGCPNITTIYTAAGQPPPTSIPPMRIRLSTRRFASR